MPQQHQKQRNVDGDQIAPFVKKSRGGLGWLPPKTISAQCSMYTAMATPGASSSVPPDQNYQKPQDFQCSWSQTLDVPDRYSNQLKLHREWEEKMEMLNDKYGLDCFSDSELDSESDEGEEYRYKHKYEMLI